MFKLLVLVLSLPGAAMAKKAKRKCSRPGCRNDAASPRAKFCTACFKKNASFASSQRKACRGGGNSSGKGVHGNSGNSSGKGVHGNSGNTTTGQKKTLAGKRSALRRSTKMLLVMKNLWLGLILAKDKTWEIRDAQTKQRGKIHLALSLSLIHI